MYPALWFALHFQPPSPPGSSLVSLKQVDAECVPILYQTRSSLVIEHRMSVEDSSNHKKYAIHAHMIMYQVRYLEGAEVFKLTSVYHLTGSQPMVTLEANNCNCY